MIESTYPTEQETAGMTKQFLSRVQLTGQEVDAFNLVTRWLGQHERPNQRVAQGECDTVWSVPEYVRREYMVLPDSLIEDFQRTKSGLYLTRMPEHYLEPE